MRVILRWCKLVDDGSKSPDLIKRTMAFFVA